MYLVLFSVLPTKNPHAATPGTRLSETDLQTQSGARVQLRSFEVPYCNPAEVAAAGGLQGGSSGMTNAPGMRL